MLALTAIFAAPHIFTANVGHEHGELGDPPTGNPGLPEWQVLDHPLALNYTYPQMGKCSTLDADFIRTRFRIVLGQVLPEEEDILDPQWGDIRLHTAWFYTHQPFTQHIDVTGGVVRFVGGDDGYDIMWELDIPVDFATDQQNQTFTHSSVRIVNAWVDFEPNKNYGRVQIPLWNCMAGTPVNTGIDRGNLPQTPPF